MKITKKSLQTMILQELISTVSGNDQINRRNIEFRTGALANLTRQAFKTLGGLEDSIRESGDLEKMDLEGLKNNELLILKNKISSIEELLYSKLKGKTAKRDLNRRNIEFGTGPFATLVRTTFETLRRLEDVVRTSGDLKKMDINGLKDNELLRLKDKISFIESFIDAKLKGKVDNNDLNRW